jgi:hypothetical protein
MVNFAQISSYPSWMKLYSSFVAVFQSDILGPSTGLWWSKDRIAIRVWKIHSYVSKGADLVFRHFTASSQWGWLETSAY